MGDKYHNPLLVIGKTNLPLQDNDGNTVFVLACNISDDENYSQLTIIF